MGQSAHFDDIAPVQGGKGGVVGEVQGGGAEALIPGGPFVMGDTFSEGTSAELPVHTVTVSAVYMDIFEGWNLALRIYEPTEAYFNGDWA